jgi:hypothetical protein
MRVRISVIIAFLLIFSSAQSQYYYKDIILTRQNQDNWKLLKEQKVRDVSISSLDANNELTPGFVCTQNISSDYSSIATITSSANTPESILTTYYDRNGRLIKTVDTSDTYKSTTDYYYNENGTLSSLLNHSLQTDNQIGATEKHIWTYEGNSLTQMIKIKNESDTTTVNLIKDEKGNIIEEKSVKGRQTLPSIYYYYDSSGRLTDIVRYNQRAGRLLPDYVFEYKYDRISSMLFVPTGSNDYQKWVYNYNVNGLKENEICYDKKKQVIVKIKYTYGLR